jgi:hypothetical protein
MNDRDPTPPDLAALFEREARTYAHYEEGKSAAYARVLERAAWVAPLFAAVQPLASGAREAASTAAAQATAKTVATKAAVAVGLKTAAISVAAITAGVVIGRATAPTALAPTMSAPPSASLVLPAASAASAASASATAVVSSEPRVEPPTLSPSALPNAPSPAVVGEGAGAKPSAVERGSLAKERDLVEAARTALARGRPADALAFVERHARDHARGQLSEEREVLAITALESLGRREEARVRRMRFARAFPDSVLLPPAAEGGP